MSLQELKKMLTDTEYKIVFSEFSTLATLKNDVFILPDTMETPTPPPVKPVDLSMYYVTYCKKLAAKVKFPIPSSKEDRRVYEQLSKWFDGGFPELAAFLDKVVEYHEDIINNTWVKSTLTLKTLQNEKIFLSVRSYLENPKFKATQRFNPTENTEKTIGEWA